MATLSSRVVASIQKTLTSFRKNPNTQQHVDHFTIPPVSFDKDPEGVELGVDHQNKRTEDDPVRFTDLLLAATLIQDAMNGRNMDYKTDPRSIRSYVMYNSLVMRCLLYAAILLLLALALFEKPAVNGLEAPYWVTMTVEGIITLVFLSRFLHAKHFDTGKNFWNDRKNITVVVCILLVWLDMICFIVWVNLDDTFAIRWSRPLRPLFIINFSDGRQIRRSFRNIRRTLVDILNVLILFMLCIALFSLLALKLFHKRNLTYPDGSGYFDNYLDSMWDLYVLVTTANDPDVMIPGYDNNNWFALFFIVYVLINNYIFMSILLAVIYNNYRKHLKNEVKSYVFAKRRTLGRAFNILKIWKDGHYVITRKIWTMLMKVLAPDRSSVQVDLLLFVLDENTDGFIERREFLKVADLLNVEVTEVKDRITLFERYMPRCYKSWLSEALKSVVRHKFFRYFFDFCILANAVFIALSLDTAEWFFLALFTLEILLKMYAYGFKRFFKGLWNIFDFLVIGSAIVATTIEAIEEETLDEKNTLDILFVLRVLRIIKIMGSIQRFKVVITTIMNIGPSILTYGGVVFVFYYIYAIVGMELFQGTIKYYGYGPGVNESNLFCGNPALNGSGFFYFKYCSNNFNDILKSFVLLFELMYVNQWHVLTQGFVLVTNKAARLYFISFHMFCVLLVLNIFVAFVLEAFILEYNLSAGKIESALEVKIKEMGLDVKSTKKKARLGTKGDKDDLVSNMEVQDDLASISSSMSSIISTPEVSPPTSPTSATVITDLSPSSNSSSAEGDIVQETTAPVDGEPDGQAPQIPSYLKQKGVKFHLKKNRQKKVLVLLEAMFENEIDPEDLGPENEEDIENMPFQPINANYRVDRIS
ncbi:uncharacterized protein LOC135484707 [Lineus longissimus]|uniref:uncharacterized protein LOC135484707 n=1 Tax=Lineus longissimus TaxID=88925 RepID=UPI002B4DB9AB